MRRKTKDIALAALAIALLGALPVVAQGAIADFKPADYVVTRDGATLDAEVWQSAIAGEMVILSDGLGSPVRLLLRSARAETVHFMKVDKRPDGGLTLLPEATDKSLGSFEVSADGQGVSFKMDGRTIELKQKPPLLGRQKLDDMKAYSRDYVSRSEAYSPSKPFVERLRSDGRDVRVEVYFGSWCPACQQMVPRIMRLAEELVGSSIEVDFYGLPQGDAFSRDPKVKGLKITGVPTAVVFVDDREGGRITANGWKIPELTLNKILLEK